MIDIKSNNYFGTVNGSSKIVFKFVMLVLYNESNDEKETDPSCL